MKMPNIIRDIFSPVLSDRTIMKYNQNGVLITTPIPETQLQPNSVDLTLGSEWRKLKPNVDRMVFNSSPNSPDFTVDNAIDISSSIQYDHGYFEDKYINGKHRQIYVLKPGEFVLMDSKEVLNIPNGILSFVHGRSSIARLGIQIEQAGLIDAGFRGTITFEIFNQSYFPIILYPGIRIAQVYFFKAERAKMAYGKLGKGSKYYEQTGPTGSRINLDREILYM